MFCRRLTQNPKQLWMFLLATQCLAQATASVARSAVFPRNWATFEVLPRVEFFVRWFRQTYFACQLHEYTYVINSNVGLHVCSSRIYIDININVCFSLTSHSEHGAAYVNILFQIFVLQDVDKEHFE